MKNLTPVNGDIQKEVIPNQMGYSQIMVGNLLFDCTLFRILPSSMNNNKKYAYTSRYSLQK